MEAFNRYLNIKLIEEIRNTDYSSLDNYIDNRLKPLQEVNREFYKSLYIDISYLLNDYLKKNHSDIVTNEGDIVIKDGDILIDTNIVDNNLFNTLLWLHIELFKNVIKNSQNIDNIELDFVREYSFTNEYKSELDKIKNKLDNSNNKLNLKKFANSDIFELKPNLFGIGININEIIKKIIRKSP